MEWTDERPGEVGHYVFKEKGCFESQVLSVHYGRWQEAQNPEYLYAGKVLLDEPEGMWFGPIPECKEEYYEIIKDMRVEDKS